MISKEDFDLALEVATENHNEIFLNGLYWATHEIERIGDGQDLYKAENTSLLVENDRLKKVLAEVERIALHAPRDTAILKVLHMFN